MGLYVGNVTAKGFYVANTPARAIYLGNQKVWPSTTSKTWSGNSDWSQDYGGDNGKRGSGYLHYGYYSSTWGNCRSLIGFNVPAEVYGCESISSMTFKFYNVHHYYNDGGDITVGVHDYSSEPSTWGDSRVDQNLQTVTDAPKPGWVTMSLNSTIREKFRTAGNLGMSLGPGPSTSLQYYGYAAKHSSSTEPWLEIKYTVSL